MEALLTEQPSFEETYIFSVSAEEVWGALTVPDTINRWHLCRVMALEPQPGGAFRLGSGGEVVIEGKITDFEPGRRFGYTFRFTAEPDDPQTEVTFQLDSLPNCCRLTVAHKGFPRYNQSYRDISACWPILMCGLQEMLKPARRGQIPKVA